jgi:hypothetical protein
MRRAESAKPKNTRNFSRVFDESGYIVKKQTGVPNCRRWQERLTPFSSLALLRQYSGPFETPPPQDVAHAGQGRTGAGHDTRALQAYLGHRNIQHTVRYTELAPDRFKDFWR